MRKTLLIGLLFSLVLLPLNPANGQTDGKITLFGRVTNSTGESIVGVVVSEAESGQAVITDVDGRFTMNVPADAILKCSSLGYLPLDVSVDGKTEHFIVLRENVELIGEVVVTGYASQVKVNLSGSVDQVTAAQLEDRPITNIAKGLQGMVPNLNIDFASGEPGRAATLNIRGETSLNGGSPLIVIDGIPSGGEELERLRPEDIESISVLKDASSAAIYGARAAFGVLLVTTKRGRGDGATVSYNNNLSWKRPSVLPSKTGDPYIYLKLKNISALNTPWSSGHVASDERLEWARQMSDNPGSTPHVRLNPLDDTQWEYMGNRDWTRYFLDRNTFSHSHQVSVSGASERASYYLSGGYDNENGLMAGIVDKDSYDRYTMRSKVSFRIADFFTLSNNTSFVSTRRQRPSYMGGGVDNMAVIYDLAPDDWDVNPDGTWANSPAGRNMARLNDGGDEITDTNVLISTFSGELSFFQNSLKLNANYTFEKDGRDYNWYRTKYMIGFGPDDIREEGDSRAWRERNVENYNIIEAFATYDKTFGRHHVTGILGYNQEYESENNYHGERYDLISPSLPTMGLASGDQYVDETYSDWAIRGVFYRAGYIYDNRYIVEFNGRYDGSSRFPRDNRFGFFPSASVAWRVDSERFWDRIRPVVSQLKLRASYGSLGNQLVSEYGYIAAMTAQAGGYMIGGQRPQTVSSAGLVSSSYTWEQVITRNFGIDLGLLNNRINATFDIYRRDTKDMLIKGKELPGVLGASEPRENAGDMKTNGWELSFAYNDSFMAGGKPLSFGAKFTLSDSRSQITRFDNPTGSLSDYYEGMKIGEIWGLQSDGFFKDMADVATLDESDLIPWGALEIVAGWPKYKDLDGDRRITKGDVTLDNPGDLSIIGNSSPRFRFGFTLNAEWNGIDFSAFLQGIGKRDYYPQSFLYWGFYQQPYAGGVEHIYDFYRAASDSDVDRAKHSQAYINAGLADQNLDAEFPVFQCWLADKNLGTGIADAMGLAIPQTKYMLDGSYLRVKNITVGYTLPREWTQKFGVSKLRVYGSIDNAFEWSALKKYYDPEAITAASAWGYVYPFNRQYSFGVNVVF